MRNWKNHPSGSLLVTTLAYFSENGLRGVSFEMTGGESQLWQPLGLGGGRTELR